MDPNKHIVQGSKTAMLAYGLAILAVILVIVGAVCLIMNNPKETVMVVLAIVGCIVTIAIIILILQVVVGIYYGAKGTEIQTDMSYSLDDQEHAESFTEAKEAPSEKK